MVVAIRREEPLFLPGQFFQQLRSFFVQLLDAPFLKATSLRWWSTGPDGWPQLVVPYDSDKTAMLSAGSGRLQQTIPHDGLLQAADLDGDGIDDLVFRELGPVSLYAFRGTPPEMWRRLGDWRPAEDFDGDGIPDLLNLGNSGAGTTAISGRDGHVLWRTSEPLRKHVALPPAHNDLDGDGRPDFLDAGGQQNSRSGIATSRGIRLPIDLHAISGRTGKRIWSAEDIVVEPEKGQASELQVGNTQVLAFPDLKGDGQPAVVLSYDLFYGSSTIRQLWLAAISLRDGKTLWRQAVSDKHVNMGSSLSIYWLPGIGDLDGDGVLDLVIAVPVPPEKAGEPWGCELRALSGRDGTPLWRRPLPLQMGQGSWANAVSVPAISNLGGNGAPQVVVLTHCTWQFEGKNLAQVLSYDGRTGEPLWKHLPKFKRSQFYEPHVFLVDPEGNGKLEVCASLGLARFRYDAVQHTRVFGTYNSVRVDPDAVPFSTSSMGYSDSDPFFHPDDSVRLDFRGQVRPALEMPIAATFDLDEKEALLLLGKGKLRVTRGGAKNIVWERSDIDDFREVYPGKSGKPAVVVVRSRDSFLGLNGATGQSLWRCPIRDAESLVPAQDPREPPWLISHADGSTICRRALATTADGDYAPAVGTPLTDARLPDDPRIVRPLPWVDLMSAAVGVPAERFVFSAMMIAGSVYLLPLLVCAVRRRWRSVAVWLAVFLVTTVAIAIVFVWIDARAMDPMEHYSLRGWYQVIYFGMDAAGVLVALWFSIRLVWRLVRWGVGRIWAGARTA